jgi:hypothetical protein
LILFIECYLNIYAGAAHSPQPQTSAKDIETALADLSASRETWKAFSNEGKAALLDECAKCLEENLNEMAMEGVAVKGSHGVGLGEEMCGFHPSGVHQQMFVCNGVFTVVACCHTLIHADCRKSGCTAVRSYISM